MQPEVSELLVWEAMVSGQGAPQYNSGEAAGYSVLPAVGDGRLHGPGIGTQSSWTPWLLWPTPPPPFPVPPLGEPAEREEATRKWWWWQQQWQQRLLNMATLSGAASGLNYNFNEKYIIYEIN